MLQLVFILPLLAGISVFFLAAERGRKILVATALVHLGVTALEWFKVIGPLRNTYFSTTPEGLLVLAIISFLFLWISIYSVSYMPEAEITQEPVFYGCMLLFLSAMSMVTLADHIIMLWVAVEATTLMSAPLIFMHHSKEALEATWKYVLICSVGIALALLGCFFIIFSMGQLQEPSTFSALNTVASRLHPLWLKAGFIFIVIGYGTKMGLAPMHTWLPDAHSEAPSPASALLSGALLNCAFLGIYRCHRLMYTAGLGLFSSNILIAFGLASMLVAAVFILNQSDYKRMLAYSSIENMGIIAFGTGIGGIAVFGALLHMIHHSLIKSSLFLSAGNIFLGYDTKIINKTGAMLRWLPKTAATFFAGFTGISGFPPFGLFISELLIIFGAVKAGRYVLVSIFIFCLILIFAGASRLVMEMVFGSRKDDGILVPEQWRRAVPSIMLLLASMALVIWLPDSVARIIDSAAAAIGGTLHG